jgi:hypothetical protein
MDQGYRRLPGRPVSGSAETDQALLRHYHTRAHTMPHEQTADRATVPITMNHTPWSSNDDDRTTATAKLLGRTALAAIVTRDAAATSCSSQW